MAEKRTGCGERNDFDRVQYKGYLLRADVRGALAYLDACGELERAQALRQRLVAPPAPATGIPLADHVLQAYDRYFQRCFTPGPVPSVPYRAQEPATRDELERRLQEILDRPQQKLDELEETLTGAFRDDGLSYLGGRTCGYYGPYLWRKTTETAYDVEIPSGREHVVVHWMEGFLLRSWLDWLSGGEFGTSGWANGGGLYCVRSVYEDELELPAFTVSFLKHEAQHQADYRYGAMAPCDLEYRAKLVELLFYEDSSFLRTLLTSGDMSDRENSHPYAAGAIVQGLSALVGDACHGDGAGLLRAAATTPAVWEQWHGEIRAAAVHLLDEHTEAVRRAAAAHAVPIAVI